ncbi:MAG: hypothetical protein HY537_16860 [Deltaproteobacteria bacterium]|nr:hypothetical protein [Deltaproteobacteria bacterium]
MTANTQHSVPLAKHLSLKPLRSIFIIFSITWVLGASFGRAYGNTPSAYGGPPEPDDLNVCPGTISAQGDIELAQSYVGNLLAPLLQVYLTLSDYLYQNEKNVVAGRNLYYLVAPLAYFKRDFLAPPKKNSIYDPTDPSAIGPVRVALMKARHHALALADPDQKERLLDQIHTLRNYLNGVLPKLEELADEYAESITRLLSGEPTVRRLEQDRLKNTSLTPDTHKRIIEDLEVVLSYLSLARRTCLIILGEAEAPGQAVRRVKIPELVSEISFLSRNPVVVKSQRPVFLDVNVTGLLDALSNLVDNAKAWGPPSEVEISVDVRVVTGSPHEITTNTQRIVVPGKTLEAGAFLAISVSDKGQGMNPQTLQKLFTGYTGRPESGGTGVGTCSVLDFVKRQGGWIEVNTVQNEGSTFTLLLPGYVEDVVQVRPLPPVRTDSGKPVATKKILVIDDHVMQQRMLTMALRLIGYDDVQSVGSRREAIALFDSGTRFDVIFTDVQTEPTDTSVKDFSLLAASLKPTPQVFLLSGTFQSSWVPGISGQLEKPVNPEALKALLEHPH